MLDEDRRDKTAVTGRALRFILGALSLVGGMTWILLNLHASSAALDVAVGAVLATGGLVLLMPHRIRLPRLLTGAVTAGFALIGTGAGLLAGQSRTCCQFAYISDRGWPYHWLQRGAVADDAETAYRLAQSASWTADLLTLAADLLIWSYVGLIVVVAVVLIGRARRTP
ncbi:hypothetical protein [Paractinoplanes lichenicola]|uniref:Disulfide bond formation protein B n=1 Tax=Paractinoplanes lichenicola TaxID=2802976 RepID=A0ABS1VJH2_9ACTN|nr:hypothetical protein [Actinoplanes lichenicola]MBL7254861.1 hypothetical protein [Actinoplanes lichenicola]